jgi:hypothetical protein
VSLLRIAIAGLIYAGLMTAWAAYEGDPFRGSYMLGFVFYAVTFGVLFGLVMKLIERWSASRADRG